MSDLTPKGFSDGQYVDRYLLRDKLYAEDAITMKGVAILNEFPAADVVEVVRCAECIYKCGETTDIIGRRMIICAATNDTHPTDWFCKWGKRNEGGQEE